MRKMLSLFILALFVMAIFTASVGASNQRYTGDQLKAVTDFAIMGQNLGKSSSQPSSLGAYASDGNSPGAIIGTSWRDDQSHISPGHYVGWRGNSTPQVHFAYGAQGCAGYTNPNVCARWHHYNMFQPTVSPGGVFVSGANGIPLQISPFAEGGAFTQAEVDENGKVIVIGEVMNSTAGDEAVNSIRMFWDDPTPGIWGTFFSDTLHYDGVYNKDLYYRQPRMAYQEYNGEYITHVVSLDDYGYGTTNSQRDMLYHRKVSTASGTAGAWTTTLLTDSVWSNHYAFGVAQNTSGVVSLAWVGYYGQGDTPPIWVMRSSDAGATWEPKFNIIDLENEEWDAWIEMDCMVDSDGYTHLIWPAGGLTPMRILHWTDRVAGSAAGGFTSIIDALDFDGLNDMCGRFGYNLFVAGKTMLTECNGRIYATWMQAGDPERGDSTDCVDPVAENGVLGNYNGDIYMSISSSLDGSLWDARRNLTNSKSPGCDGTDALPCDHDNYPSPSRIGMNTAPSVVGPTFWSSVPEAFEVRDALDASYPDTGYYIDMQFINDIFPGISRYNDDVLWTNNPIKWFRLPCVPPVIEPRIFMPTAYQHPEDWVKAGVEESYDAEVLNLGNAPLTITNVTANIIAGAGWLTINTTSLTIPAASSDLISMTLNPGGAINPAPGSAVGIEAWLIVTSDDPNKPVDSFQIRTIIADTVVPIVSEVVTTGKGVQLGVLTNGNAGNYPNTGAYMQFFNDSTGLDEDCDSAEVYLYELSPVIMYSAAEGDYFWNGYYAFNDPEPEVNMVPVSTSVGAELCSSGGMNQYITGHFVTADSAIGMNKVWGAPDENVSYIIEKWEIYSYDGATHTGVNIAEWIDQDVPSDSGANNVGGVVEADDYIYAYGQVGDPAGCTPADGRFYMTGLLGYYNVSELAGDAGINHTGLSGAYVTYQDELMTTANSFIPDSVWSYLSRNEFATNNTTPVEDQRMLVDFGTFDITTDTLVIWIVHGTLINSDVAGVAAQNADAKVWYMANRDAFGVCGCCGTYTGGYPGNIDFGSDGKRNLADITALIDHVYINKNPLLCDENGDVNYDTKNNLADITSLIDHVYIGKNEFDPCQ